MALLVHKYGGSSVAGAEKIMRVAERVIKAKNDGNDVVVVVSAMGDSTDELIELAHTVSKDPEPREMDLLLSTGELVSCTLLSMAIKSMGYEAVSLTGNQAGIVTDTMYGHARISRVDSDRIKQELLKGRVAVVAGFQGMTETQDITTLGRGGSDTTAVALAAALKADRCDIYTDVEGIYTADPRIVPKARKMLEIGYQEMLELASYGAKMHPRSIELGSVYQVPIYVASSFSEETGTLIHKGPDEIRMEDRIKVTGIAYQSNIAKVTVRAVPDRPGMAAELFEPLSVVGVSVDTIVQNTSVERLTDISFTVDRSDLQNALRQLDSVTKEMGAGDVVTDPTLASISVVGSGMQNTPGYASKMFRILSDANVNIEMITTSEIRISCIIKEDQVPEAVRLLHEGFGLDKS